LWEALLECFHKLRSWGRCWFESQTMTMPVRPACLSGQLAASSVPHAMRAMPDGQQVPATPQVVAFAFDELPWGLLGLVAQLRLLVANLAQL
jgi:hypothetical protein